MPNPVRILVLLLVSLTTVTVAAAGRELSPRGLGPTTYVTMGPQVAFTGGRFLTIWREYRLGLGTPIMAALSDSTGRRISERAFALDAPGVRLTAAGDGFAVAWRTHQRAPQMALIDPDGRVTAVRTLPLPSDDSPIVAFGSNGTHFVAVAQGQGSARSEAFLFDREGRLLHGPVRMPYAATAFDVVALDDRLLLVSFGEDGLRVMTMTSDSVIERTYFDPLVPRHANRAVVGVAKSNGDVLLVWSGASRDTQAKSTLYRTDGTFAPASSIESGTGLLVPVELMQSGDSFILTFLRTDSLASTEASAEAMRLDANGATAGEAVVLDARATPRASAATSGNTTLVAYETPTYPTRIAAVAVGADARPREPETLSLAFARQTQPVLTATQGNVLALWTEQMGDAAAVRAAAIDANGEPVASSHVAAAFLAATETAWNGVHHLVVHHDTTRLMATRVAADGTAVDTRPTVLATFDHIFPGRLSAAVVWTGNEWLVVWPARAELRIATVLRDGFATVSRPLPVQGPLPGGITHRDLHTPAIAFDGRHVLLVWSEAWYSSCCSIPGAGPDVEKTAGALLTPAGVPKGNPAELDLPPNAPLSIASSGNEFMVVAGSRAVVIDADQGRLNVTANRELFNWHTLSDVTWDGRNYVAALRYRVVNWYLAVRRLDRNGNDVGAYGTETLRAESFEPPSIAAQFPGRTLVGVQEGTADEGARAVLYRETDLRELRPAPAAPENVTLRSLSAGRVEVRWDASGDVELYSVEVHENGSWHTVTHVPAGTLTATFYRYSPDPLLVRVRAVNGGGASTPAEAVPLQKRRSVR